MFVNPADRARRCAVALAVAGLAGTGLVAVSAALAQAAPEERVTNFGFNAQSYGSRTTGNPNASSGATAISFLPCTREVPRSRSNFASTAGDDDGVQLNNVRTRNRTEAVNRQVAAISTVRIEDGTLAGGQVAFSNAHGKVVSRHNRKGYDTNTLSSIGSLQVGGIPVDLPLDGSQPTIPVPGPDGGTLTINRQVRKSNQKAALGAVNVMRFDGDDGTTERVGRAFSRIDGNVEGGVFRGQAFGSESRTDGTVDTGKSAVQPIPCPGTEGDLLVNRQGGAVLDFGAIGEQYSAARGVQRNNAARGYTFSRIDRAGFSGQTLQFRNIRGLAQVERRSDGSVSRKAKNTGVGTILVNGEEQETPPPGEPQNVAGVGTFTVRLVNRTRNGIDVTAVRVRLRNGTPDPSDDTIVDLGNAKLSIKRS